MALRSKNSGEMEALKDKKENYKRTIIWTNVTFMTILHIGWIYGWFLVFSGKSFFLTFINAFVIGYLSGLAITIGAHRLWTHRSFKAKLPLRLLLLFGQTISGQDSLWQWVKVHRQHHKYSDTNADPHNSKRGFFFSHIGWLLVSKHPEVVIKGRQIDMSDLQADPWIMFQKRYYRILYLVFVILIPVAIPCYFWNETVWNSFMVSYLGRYGTLLNITWSVNSFAHMFGTRPYDKNLQPVENKYVSFFAAGEGWHNYHHVFPWDCNAAELGVDYNLSAKILEFLEWIGQAYDLKKATKEMTMKRVQKYGDGTHPIY